MKKMLAAALCAMLLLTAICATPPAVFAANNQQTWASLQAALMGNSTSVSLRNNVVAGENDTALIVNGDKTLWLNGYTIDRAISDQPTIHQGKDDGYVIKVMEGTLTIRDDSTDKREKSKAAGIPATAAYMWPEMAA